MYPVDVDKMRSVPMNHPDELEMKRRIGGSVFMTTMFTRRGRVVGIDAGVIPEEVSDKQIEKFRVKSSTAQGEIRSEVRTAPGAKNKLSDGRSPEAGLPEISSAVTKSQLVAIKPWQILRLKQDVIVVVEQSKIEALSPERYKELLEIAGLNHGKLHLVIPDMLHGKYSDRVAELKKIASVYEGFPQRAASNKIPVIGFSDMERDTLAAFQKRLDPELAGRIKDSAFGLNQAGSFGVGILYALKDISSDQLRPNQNGFRYDATGRYSAQVLEVLQAYTVISTSA
jgi:hypothetical protein